MIPRMQNAIPMAGNPVQFSVVFKSVVDYEVSEQRAAVKTTAGVLQPIPDRELNILPEGQRNWKHWSYWTQDDLELDWELLDSAGLQFRVMSKADWAQAGYRKYRLTQQPIQ